MKRTAHELIADCDEAGLRIHVTPEGALQVVGPRAALTPAVEADLRRLKSVLLAVLTVCDCQDCCRRRIRSRTSFPVASDSYLPRVQSSETLSCKRPSGV